MPPIYPGWGGGESCFPPHFRVRVARGFSAAASAPTSGMGSVVGSGATVAGATVMAGADATASAAAPAAMPAMPASAVTAASSCGCCATTAASSCSLATPVLIASVASSCMLVPSRLSPPPAAFFLRGPRLVSRLSGSLGATPLFSRLRHLSLRSTVVRCLSNVPSPISSTFFHLPFPCSVTSDSSSLVSSGSQRLILRRRLSASPSGAPPSTFTAPAPPLRFFSGAITGAASTWGLLIGIHSPGKLSAPLITTQMFRSSFSSTISASVPFLGARLSFTVNVTASTAAGVSAGTPSTSSTTAGQNSASSFGSSSANSMVSKVLGTAIGSDGNRPLRARLLKRTTAEGAMSPMVRAARSRGGSKANRRSLGGATAQQAGRPGLALGALACGWGGR
mmetsp:Transcript_28830/g.72317  ORF Transcript_28830/g.72317 Transcript_28830/m.72317 type:complete len:394 (-) Transcript_28830:89-1270(-)